MSIEEIAQTHSGKISLGALLTLLVAVVGGALTFDERYAHAEGVTSQFQKQQIFIQQSMNSARVKQLENQIFILDFNNANGQNTPLNKALRSRYMNELNSIR